MAHLPPCAVRPMPQPRLLPQPTTNTKAHLSTATTTNATTRRSNAASAANVRIAVVKAAHMADEAEFSYAINAARRQWVGAGSGCWAMQIHGRVFEMVLPQAHCPPVAVEA